MKRCLSIFDSGFGLGDSLISIPTLLQLQKEGYLLRLITQSKNIPIYKMAPINFERLCDMNSQQRFFINDFNKILNGLYWWKNGKVSNFEMNVIHYFAEWNGVEKYDGVLPDLQIPEYELKKARELLNKLSPKKPTIIYQTLMSFWNKMIEYEKWQEVFDILSKDFTIIQVGAKIDFKNVISLSDKTTIFESIALAKESNLLMGGDSFFNHLSGFVKTPGVFVWTSTGPEDYGYPWNRNIWHPEMADCLPCGRPLRWIYDYDYPNPNSWERSDAGWVCPDKFCSKSITSDEIVAQTYNLFDEINTSEIDFSLKDYKKEEDTRIPELFEIRKKDLPKLSFVIVVYDKLDKLNEVINGIRENCPYDYEIILVDNGDNGLHEYFGKDDIRVLEYTSNLGYGGGNNAGIEFSNNEYIIIINPDLIIIDKVCIERLIHYAGKDCISGKLVGTGDWYTYPASFPTYKILKDLPFYYNKPTHTIPGWKPMPYIDGSLICFHKEIFEKTGGFDSGLPEKAYFDEAPFMFKAYLNGFQLADAKIDGYFDHQHTDYPSERVINWTKINRDYFYQNYALPNWRKFLSYLSADCVKK